MNALLAISRAIDAVNSVFGRICEYLVLFVCFISAGNALMRYLFNYSSNAYLEIQWYMFGGIVLLGGAFTFLRNEHVRVDVLYSHLSDRGRIFVDLFGIIVFLMPAAAILSWMSWPFFFTSFRSGEVSMNAGGLILWPAKLLLPVGFTLLLFQAFSELVKRLAALQGVITLDTKYEKPLQ